MKNYTKLFALFVCVFRRHLWISSSFSYNLMLFVFTCYVITRSIFFFCRSTFLCFRFDWRYTWKKMNVTCRALAFRGPVHFFSASLEPFHYCMCVFSSGVSKIKCKNQLFDLVSKGKIKEMKFTIEQQDMKIIVLNFLARALTLLRHITKMPVFSIKVGREFFFLSGSTAVVFSP